ncbi:MAG: flagellar assembly protein FliH [Gammaproteobacteria bacterium]|nr:flagellar assembly protein FliH [Gammaproteobacteria bacterium]
MSSRLIRAGDIAVPCEPWQAPQVIGPTLRSQGASLDDLRAARQQAVQEGFEEGRRAGLEAARKETLAAAQALERVLDVLSRPFEGLEQRFHEEIVELVKAVTRQLVRRELRLDPTHIIGVVREGLAALPLAATDIMVRMHPEDAAVMRECLAGGTPEERPWRIEADPLVERGGCLIAGASSIVDGRLETRLGRVIAAMFEDERQEDSDAPGAQDGH